MKEAHRGDRIRVNYNATFPRHEFPANDKKRSVEFTVGSHEVILGIEDAVVGMKEGEAREVILPSEKAFGPRKKELTVKVQKSNLPADFKPETGKKVRLTNGKEDEDKKFTISSIDNDTITLDANHPLAGLDLKFRLELEQVH
ncbi:MAG: peptidylprolyl isomerase [Chitinivibrionales bacterium]|nr:peptidylprolyl isomerase [Chitinivibrionales bacterium]